MTIEGIKEGVSMPRNPVIARVFQILGWVEQFVTGYLRITKSCVQHDYPLPNWREIGPYTDIIFKPLVMESIHREDMEARFSADLASARDPVGTRSR